MPRIAAYPVAAVEPFGFPMDVRYDYDPGEPPVYWGPNPCPGAAPAVEVLEVLVGGVDIYPMLDNDQIERIEAAVLRECGE